jgi:hypothetical protein
MTKITSLHAIAAALLSCGLAAAPAQAGPNRTFVSGLGTDSGTCTRPAPCRTFAFALTVTTAGGEIDVLDPAGYGPVTIIHDGEACEDPRSRWIWGRCGANVISQAKSLRSLTSIAAESMPRWAIPCETLQIPARLNKFPVRRNKIPCSDF